MEAPPLNGVTKNLSWKQSKSANKVYSLSTISPVFKWSSQVCRANSGRGEKSDGTSRSVTDQYLIKIQSDISGKNRNCSS